ncbi:MAG: hypothetical protein MJE63_27575 [Proteobacteria bacterium]|nr:hypothetical protein [Pseudomonadota bacterium]
MTGVKSAFAAFCVLLLLTGYAWSDYADKTLTSGEVRLFYSTSSPASCDVILFGVGTNMGVDQYDKMSTELISYGYVVGIMDHNPGNMVKTDATKFTTLVEDIKLEMVDWLATSGCTTIAHWIVGGHSASGQAAQEALSVDPALADAIYSMDPYDATAVGNVLLPALYWGFDVTTCQVTKSDAAEAAYLRSDGQRVFHRVAKKSKWGLCFVNYEYYHCSIADQGCTIFCSNCKSTPNHFYVDVANSVHKFIEAAFYGTWSKENLAVDNPTTPITLFVDTDLP